MLRSLIHHWRMNLAVIGAAAVTTAVLTGALLVGDSVRASLRDLTLDRLGSIDRALVARGFFREGLADDLAHRLPDRRTAPVLLLRGTVVHAESRTRAASVAVHGIDRRFAGLFADGTPGADDLPGTTEEGTSHATSASDRGGPGQHDDVGVPGLERESGQVFSSILVSRSLARELDAAVGDPLLVHFQLGAEIPQDTLAGRRDPERAVATLRARVSRILPDRGMGRFGLSPHQGFPLNAYLALDRLQRLIGQPERVNGLMLSVPDAGDARAGGGRSGPQGRAGERPTERGSTTARRTGEPTDGERLETETGAGTQGPVDPRRALSEALTLADLGLRVKTGGGVISVESREHVLGDVAVDDVLGAAGELGAAVLPIQTYIANTMRVDDRTVPYSAVAALDPPPADDPSIERMGTLRLVDGRVAPVPGPEEILINEWTASDLDADVGDRLEMSYYVFGPDERLRTDTSRFRVAGIVAMSGLAAEPSLTPDYPGIAEADDIATWDPPFPVDLDRIRPRDEEYWDRYRGTPKAFVGRETGRRLWSTRYGATTSVRVAPPATLDADAFADRLEATLLEGIEPEDHGLVLRPVRREGLRAARGATDFGQLFLGFSSFLIVSAALLVGLLFRLGVERRANEVGLLRAVGFPESRVRRRMLGEGGTLASLGAALGLAGGAGYAAAMMAGLRTLWRPAVGTSRLHLEVQAGSLALGWTISVAVILASVWWTVRRLGRVPVAALLAGSLEGEPEAADARGPRRRTRVLAVGGLLLALGLAAFAWQTGATSSPALSFGVGASLLASGLAAFVLWCRRSPGIVTPSRFSTLTAMAARNSAWNPGRSILSVALVACASFVIVTVATNQRDPTGTPGGRHSGSGGYPLMATSSVPLHHDLGSPETRSELGFPPESDELLSGVRFTAFRLRPGDDASCLNLYRPRDPRVLGVPQTQIERGGFEFAAAVEERENPWELLRSETEPGVIPAIGDANSVRWILHLGLGEELEIRDDRGRTVRLRLVALLQESVFQSELLVSERDFLRHFPERGGFSYFLIDAPAESVDRLVPTIEETLAPYGFDVTPTEEVLAGYLAVQNTYLSTFQLLGGLGLLLGTLGLGIVLLRNVLDRRGELATLRAFGFRRRRLTRLILAENGFLLITGLAVGSVAAALAVAPRLVSGGIEPPWGSLAATLVTVLAVGLSSSAAAVVVALRAPLLPELKRDR